jgi:hypothetical protein
LLEEIFKLMIDIDEEIAEDWLNPKPGYYVDDTDEVSVTSIRSEFFRESSTKSVVDDSLQFG